MRYQSKTGYQCPFHRGTQIRKGSARVTHCPESNIIDGARAIGLEHLTGSIKAGKQADIIILDRISPTWFP